MSIDPSQVALRRVLECGVCGNRQLDSAIDLPDLPLTALFTPQPLVEQPARYNQGLLVCATCGHAQAANQVEPSLLYGSDYGFRTADSDTARRGSDFFIGGLNRFAGSRRFKCVLDWGCNDLHLLGRLESRADIRIGVDPIWDGREHENTDPTIQVIGSTLEALDLPAAFRARPDLIVCRHTLEHIAEPCSTLQRLIEFAADDALFVFETPGFDALVRRYRFDQVFHEHLQYFNLTTFQRLIAGVEAEYLGFQENYHDWGALLVAFQKRGHRTLVKDVSPAPFSLSDVQARYQVFRDQLHIFNEVLQSFEGSTLYGYGAAQMLPVLAYHMNNDLKSLTAILDDDPTRDGWYFQNLVPPILCPTDVTDLTDATVFVTAMDSVKPILLKLMSHRPRHVLIPFHTF